MLVYFKLFIPMGWVVVWVHAVYHCGMSYCCLSMWDELLLFIIVGWGCTVYLCDISLCCLSLSGELVLLILVGLACAVGPKLWNELPLNLRNCVSLDIFKSQLKSWSFADYFLLLWILHDCIMYILYCIIFILYIFFLNCKTPLNIFYK